MHELWIMFWVIIGLIYFGLGLIPDEAYARYAAAKRRDQLPAPLVLQWDPVRNATQARERVAGWRDFWDVVLPGLAFWVGFPLLIVGFFWVRHCFR